MTIGLKSIMCQFHAGKKIKDCKLCYCEYSIKFDKHKYKVSGEITVGKTTVKTKRCTMCSKYK